MRTLLDLAQWLAIGALASLVWLQHHMWMTGSSFTAFPLRWAFSMPFYALLIATSLSAAIFFARLMPRRWLGGFVFLSIGICIPATILVVNYHCLGEFCWYVRLPFQHWIIK